MSYGHMAAGFFLLLIRASAPLELFSCAHERVALGADHQQLTRELNARKSAHEHLIQADFSVGSNTQKKFWGDFSKEEIMNPETSPENGFFGQLIKPVKRLKPDCLRGCSCLLFSPLTFWSLKTSLSPT